MKRKWFAVLLLLAGITGVNYGLTGDEVLSRVETLMTKAKDSYGLATMTLGSTEGGSQEVRQLEMWMAGKDKRVIKFVKPASMKDIGLLVNGEEEMYVYLPAQKKVRRISGGAKNEDFQGTDFSYDEMGSYEYKKDYTASVDSEDDTTYHLTLTRKSGSEKTYTTMKMTVNKQNFVPTYAEMYQDSTLVKVLKVGEIKEIKGYIMPVNIRVENKVKKHYTEMKIDDLQFDQGLEAADTFSLRFLKK